MIIIFVQGYGIMRVQFPNLALMCVPIFLGIILFPAIFPIWGTGLYWFMMSFALLPIFIKLFPMHFCNKDQGHIE